MTYRSDEIEIVESWREVWWDLVHDKEFITAVTGTLGRVMPPVEKRRIQDAYGKRVHKGCGGEVALHPDNPDVGVYRAIMVCAKCHKEIVVEI